MKLDLSLSTKARFDLDAQQAKVIAELYSQVLKDLKEREKYLNASFLSSAKMALSQVNDLKASLLEELDGIRKRLEKEIPKDMTTISDAVVNDNKIWANSLGMEPRLGKVSTDVVSRLVFGEVYEGDWTLSKALWKDYHLKKEDINYIVAKGVAQNKSAFSIAKDLEKYVDPMASKDSRKIVYNTYTLNGVVLTQKEYERLSKEKKAQCEVKKETYNFGRVDYNAQRLARTMVSHAYQQSLVLSCKDNPFVTGIRWDASNSGRVCPICLERDGQVFPKDDLPMDHPNGMCTYEAVLMDDDSIIDRLADWVNGEDDSEIDLFATKL